MDGEQGKVVVCVDARFTGGSFPLLVLCLYILRILYAGVIVCTMDPECGGNLMVFTRKSAWCFFFGSNYQRKSAEIYSYIVESSQLLTMHMGPRRQKTIRDASQSEVPAEYEK